jgi:tRNA threonylcarbamoyladenosine biosynthesis protein TsaB
MPNNDPRIEKIKESGTGVNAGTGLILAMDTSTASMTIALLEGEKVLGETHSLTERNHSVRLVPEVRQLLEAAGKTVEDVDMLAVGYGPGSYTGVRIGVTVGKTIAWALDIPIIGVSSLEALAYGGIRLDAPEDGAVWYVPLMDARRGRVYTGLYALSGGEWLCLEGDGNRPLQEWAEQIMDRARESAKPPKRVVFLGETQPFAEIIEETNREKLRVDAPGPEQAQIMAEGFVQIYQSDVSAVDVGLVGRKIQLIDHIEPVDAHDFVPNYTQVEEAEARWIAAGNNARRKHLMEPIKGSAKRGD